jgi:hypothetical protein
LRREIYGFQPEEEIGAANCFPTGIKNAAYRFLFLWWRVERPPAYAGVGKDTQCPPAVENSGSYDAF